MRTERNRYMIPMSPIGDYKNGGGGLKTENLELGQDLSEFDLVKIISDIAYKNDIENILQYAIGDFDTKGDEVVFNSGTTHYTSITK